MATGYSITAGAALVAATAKTAINLITGSARVPKIIGIDVTFDGASPTAVPVLVELCSSTQGAAGTSTPFTPLLLRGDPAEAAQSTAGVNYTAEPTTLAVLKGWYVTPTGGVIQQLPLGREIEGVIAAATARKGLALRLTAPAVVNYKANFEFEE